MTIHLDHTIVETSDPRSAAHFLAELLGLPAPQEVGSFWILRIDDTSLDFIAVDGEIHPQHYAFLVSEAEFDAIFARIQNADLKYWANPSRSMPGSINTWDGGRGVYWNDPNGHLLEIITRPYGSGGSTTDQPHPLVASKNQTTK